MTTPVEQLFHQMDREIWIVTTRCGERLGGLVSTTVSQASIVRTMPRILLTLARTHQTTDFVRESGTFAVQLIDASHADLVWRFGLQSGYDTNKWEGVGYRLSELGNPILDSNAGWLDCRVEAMFDIGDRWIVVGEVEQGEVVESSRLLRMSELVDVATSEQLRMLRELVAQDAQRDENAIRTWRTSHRFRPPAGE